MTCQAHPVLVKRANQTVHLWTDQRIPGPVSCRCPGRFVGDPASLARDNIKPWQVMIRLHLIQRGGAYSLEEKNIPAHKWLYCESANMPDIHKIPFDYCLDRNFWQSIIWRDFNPASCIVSAIFNWMLEYFFLQNCRHSGALSVCPRSKLNFVLFCRPAFIALFRQLQSVPSVCRPFKCTSLIHWVDSLRCQPAFLDNMWFC